MNIFEAIFLGMLQGLTEWLPVSSSGHLVIFQQFFNINPPLIFNTALHMGTLVVILYVYHREVVNILKSLLKGDVKSENGQLGLMLIAGTIPTFLIGIIFRTTLEAFFYSLEIVALAFILTGVILYSTKRGKNTRGLSFFDAILIGAAQGVAIIPGISRSGSTVGFGIIRDIKGEIAVKYSFLLSIPVIMGATIVEFNSSVQVDYLLPIALGTLTSMIMGYISYKVLVRFVNNRSLHNFAYYCWALGAILLIIILL